MNDLSQCSAPSTTILLKKWRHCAVVQGACVCMYACACARVCVCCKFVCLCVRCNVCVCVCAASVCVRVRVCRIVCARARQETLASGVSLVALEISAAVQNMGWRTAHQQFGINCIPWHVLRWLLSILDCWWDQQPVSASIRTHRSDRRDANMRHGTPSGKSTHWNSIGGSGCQADRIRIDLTAIVTVEYAPGVLP
jgi:hypothetical protein